MSMDEVTIFKSKEDGTEGTAKKGNEKEEEEDEEEEEEGVPT